MPCYGLANVVKNDTPLQTTVQGAAVEALRFVECKTLLSTRTTLVSVNEDITAMVSPYPYWLCTPRKTLIIAPKS